MDCLRSIMLRLPSKLPTLCLRSFTPLGLVYTSTTLTAILNIARRIPRTSSQHCSSVRLLSYLSSSADLNIIQDLNRNCDGNFNQNRNCSYLTGCVHVLSRSSNCFKSTLHKATRRNLSFTFLMVPQWRIGTFGRNLSFQSNTMSTGVKRPNRCILALFYSTSGSSAKPLTSPLSSPLTSPLRGIQKDVSPLSTSRVTRRKKQPETQTLDKDVFDVTAYASAEEYNLENLKKELKASSIYTVQPLPQDALDAVHAVAQSPGKLNVLRQIFLFREGTVVFWNVPKDEQQEVLRFVSRYQTGSYDKNLVQVEGVENLDFIYTEHRTSLINGTIHVQHAPSDATSDAGEAAINRQLEMFTFSNALAHSVKLSIWEASLSHYVASVEWVLQDLKDGKKIRMSEADVLRKAGELFTLSHLINLSSDLLDAPDFYWDRNNLEKLYRATFSHLSIARRVKVMNEKLAQCVELTELLRDHLKDKHHTRLELMIIFLILIEVIFGVVHLVEKYFLVDEVTGTAAALQQQLQLQQQQQQQLQQQVQQQQQSVQQQQQFLPKTVETV